MMEKEKFTACKTPCNGYHVATDREEAVKGERLITRLWNCEDWEKRAVV